MTVITSRRIAGAAAVALALGLYPVAAQASPTQTSPAESDCAWTVQQLPAVAGYAQQYGKGTDHAGHVFGEVSNDHGDTGVPVVWSVDPAEAPRVLGSAHDAPTTVTALNAAGVAAGYYRDATGRHPVRFADGRYQDLPVPAGENFVEAVDVNAAGDIIGNTGEDIILWPAADPGSFRLLPKPAGTSASANAIDDAGNVVGNVSQDSASGVRIEAYLWDSAGRTVALPPAAAGAWVEPKSIRNGRVLGAEFGGSQAGIVVWDLSGAVQWHLGPEYGANSINADGLVNGWQGVPDGLISRLFQDGQVVATPPVEFDPAGSSSALTDAGVLAGTSGNRAAVAQCR